MKITDIEAIPFRLPLRRDFRWASLRVALGGFVLVRVRTDEGVVGFGEATPLPDWGGDFGRRAGETQATVVEVVRNVLRPALMGRDAAQIDLAIDAMDKALRGHSYAKCAIEIALHDILGKVARMPIHRLLGGAYRDRLPVAHMIGIMPNEEAVAEGEGALADGIRAFQIKGGLDAERDIRLITELRRRLGDDIVLRLDANQGYADAKTAIAVLERMKDARPDYVEQPVEGLDAMRRVREAGPIRVIADESCWSAHDALDLVHAGAADVISIYLAKAGGMRGAMAVGAIARASGLPCDVNGSIESGIGNAANLQFGLATASVTLACVIPVSAPLGRHPCRVGGHYYEDDIITEPFRVADGALLPLDGPGLGIEIDEAKLERYRED